MPIGIPAFYFTKQNGWRLNPATQSVMSMLGFALVEISSPEMGALRGRTNNLWPRRLML
jgi:hypothetical protein